MRTCGHSARSCWKRSLPRSSPAYDWLRRWSPSLKLPARKLRCVGTRTRQLIGFAVEFYRQLLRARAGADPLGDDGLRRYVLQAAATQPGDAETAADCIDRSLEALAHVDRNAHQTTLLECWLDDLARILSGQPVASYGGM